MTWVECEVCAGGIYDRQHTETAGRQLAYYKGVYEEVGKSILGSGAIKGILFWRWKAADPTIVLGSDDQAATLGELLNTLIPCNLHK
jgi:hypothetical protein